MKTLIDVIRSKEKRIAQLEAENERLVDLLRNSPATNNVEWETKRLDALKESE